MIGAALLVWDVEESNDNCSHDSLIETSKSRTNDVESAFSRPLT